MSEDKNKNSSNNSSNNKNNTKTNKAFNKNLCSERGSSSNITISRKC